MNKERWMIISESDLIGNRDFKQFLIARTKFCIFVRKNPKMDTKLTLKLDQAIIEKAKFYAKTKKTSVSKLIENYLQCITENSSNDKQEITPVVKSLSGIIKLTKNYNSKKEYADFLIQKYK